MRHSPSMTLPWPCREVLRAAVAKRADKNARAGDKHAAYRALTRCPATWLSFFALHTRVRSVLVPTYAACSVTHSCCFSFAPVFHECIVLSFFFTPAIPPRGMRA